MLPCITLLRASVSQSVSKREVKVHHSQLCMDAGGGRFRVQSRTQPTPDHPMNMCIGYRLLPSHHTHNTRVWTCSFPLEPTDCERAEPPRAYFATHTFPSSLTCFATAIRCLSYASCGYMFGCSNSQCACVLGLVVVVLVVGSGSSLTVRGALLYYMMHEIY